MLHDRNASWFDPFDVPPRAFGAVADTGLRLGQRFLGLVLPCAELHRRAGRSGGWLVGQTIRSKGMSEDDGGSRHKVGRIVVERENASVDGRAG